MSTHLAELSPDTGFLKTAAFADDLPPLDGLPWLAPPGPAREALGGHDSPFGTVSARLRHRAAIAAAVAALCGGAWLLADHAPSQREPAMAQATILHAETAATPAARTGEPVAETTARLGVAAPERAALLPDGGPGRAGQASRSAPANPVTVHAPPPALTAAPPPATAQLLAPAPAAAAVVAAPPPPAADSAVSAATLGELRATMDQCRDAIRAVIRLGDRHRPGRGASAEEQVGYRLRQQNAEAAKTYRRYLGTLARSVRGVKLEDAARQSLDRARQTLAYLETMRADSQASLR